MTTALICIALLALLVFALGLAVSLTRGATKRNIGHSDDPADWLHKLCRAHGNATEYGPILALLMLVLAMREPAAWVLWTMIVVTAARYVHAAGMLMGPTLARLQPLRFVGALVTYVGGAALAIALFLTI